jgi:hypothetical protein
MDAQTHGQGDLPLLLQAGIELAHGFHDPEPSLYRPLGVVFMRQGIAEVDE